MARSPEIVALEEAFRAAQARLGIAAAYLAGEAWTNVPVKDPAKGAATWIDTSARAALVLRARSARLAKAYYQYARGLQTGYLAGQPDLPEGVPLTLNSVRDAFVEQLKETAQLGLGATGLTTIDDMWLDDLLSATLRPQNPRASNLLANDLSRYIDNLLASDMASDKSLRVDTFTWPGDMPESRFREILSKYLTENAITPLEGKIAKAQEVKDDAIREIHHQKDHEKSGSRGAGYVDHFSISAGRSLLSYVGRRDKRVQLVARGTSGNPCYWCAMLASRGFVYRSTASAGFDESGVSDWHPNCHCYPIYRFVNLSTTDDDAPTSTKYYEDLWNKHISGVYSGKEAIREWRKLLTGLALAAKQRATIPGGS